jgi:hypothetical protein
LLRIPFLQTLTIIIPRDYKQSLNAQKCYIWMKI